MMTLTLTALALTVALVLADRVMRGRRHDATRYWRTGK